MYGLGFDKDNFQIMVVIVIQSVSQSVSQQVSKDFI